MSNNNQLQVRKNEKLATISKNSNQSDNPFVIEINQAWEAYREQVQRNFEMMKIISDQQLIIQQLKINGIPQIQPIQPLLEQPQAATPEPLTELKSIPLKQSQRLEKIFRTIDSETKRTDAIQHFLEMLFSIHQVEEIYADKLYMHMSLPDSTGYRHTRHLQKLGFVKHSRGKLILTKAGNMFMQSQLDSREKVIQLSEQLTAEGVFVNSGLLQNTFHWFDQQTAKQ